MEHIGERIRELRTEKGWKQEQLAKRIGVNRSSISQWENGFTKKLMGTNLLALANIFNVKPEWLETGKGEKHWKDATGYVDGYYNLGAKPPGRDKIDAILDIADSAMDDTGKKFTADERIDLYMEAIEFALRREFPHEFVDKYMSALIKERNMDKNNGS